MIIHILWRVGAFVLAGTCALSLCAQEGVSDNDRAPTGKGIGTRYQHGPSSGVPGPDTESKTNGINYHGGPVMLGTTNVYYIWYGNWAGDTAVSILTDLANTIGGSPYFNINTTYWSRGPHFVSNSVHYAGSTTDKYSKGKSLTDASVEDIVITALDNGSLPKDVNGVYFVLTSKDVNETSGFCGTYCGWHTNGSIGGLDIKYAFVGDSQRCLSSCAAQSKGPNGNAGADGMASVIAHELEESVTDPNINAWFDPGGNENADKCAWTFGKEYKAANGALANMRLGTRDFLIQQNWLNAGGGSCELSH